MKKSLIASAIMMAFTGTSFSATTDYSNQTVDTVISVIGSGNSITGDNVSVIGSSLEPNSNRNEGIYIGQGSSAYFGGGSLEVKFTTDDNTHEFAGIQVNGQKTGDANAIFDSDLTVIEVSGPGSPGKWGFGLLVNGLGTDTASAKFTGGDVYVSTTNSDYTSQSVTVKANATLEFSNTGNVEIHSYSSYGVTAVDAQGTLTFNNDGNVLLKGEILPGSHTAQTNVVGIQGYDAIWNVTDRVQEFKIDLAGAGVDNDGTSYSTGTKGIDAGGDDMVININSQSFVINMDVASDIVDDSPEGHTSEKAYGICIENGAKLNIGSSTVTSINVHDGVGTSYGIYVGTGATVKVNGDLSINSTGKNESFAIYLDGVDAASEEEEKPVYPVSLSLGGNNQITGNIVAINQSTLSFNDGLSFIDGNVTSDKTSVLALNDSSIELAEGSKIQVLGSLTSNNGEIVLNDASVATVSIASLKEGSSLRAVAVPSLNDKLGGDITSFSQTLNIDSGAQGVTLFMQEGMVAGESSAQLASDGTVDASTIQTKTNSLMSSTLDMASTMPLLMTRILTNDVRKRLGDIRSTPSTYGVWARYDGGNFSGENGLDSDFHTIQVGADTLIDTMRFGLAFSYIDGDTDYSRGVSDFKVFSLAGYGTWLADNGQYVDVVARLATIENDMKVDGHLSGTMDNIVASLSAEAGWRFSVNSLLYIEPQVEMAYSYVDGDNFDIGSAHYKIDATDSLVGRVGFVSGFKCPNDRGDLYMRASVVHEFMGDSKISGLSLGSRGTYEMDGKDTWVEYGVGANINVSDMTYVWADLERTSGGSLDEDWRATIGIRHAF